MAAVAVGFLLEPAPDLIDRVPAQFHNVEGVNDGDRVLEFVIDGVLVVLERGPVSLFHSGSERRTALFAPACGYRPGTARTKSNRVARVLPSWVAG